MHLPVQTFFLIPLLVFQTFFLIEVSNDGYVHRTASILKSMIQSREDLLPRLKKDDGWLLSKGQGLLIFPLLGVIIINAIFSIEVSNDGCTKASTNVGN